MKQYDVVTVQDAMDRIEELETMDYIEFCSEVCIPQSTYYKKVVNRVNVICDVLTREYGHDILIHWICQGEENKLGEDIILESMGERDKSILLRDFR
jgi:hypothetical protein